MRFDLSRMIMVLGAGGLLSACSLFSLFSSDPPAASTHYTLTVNFIADALINPTSDGTSQPIKVCLYQASQPGWLPEGALSGSPCGQAGKTATGRVSYSTILAPKTQKEFVLEIPVGQPVWLVMGAEFQQLNSAHSLLELRAPAENNMRINIIIYRNWITAITPTRE